MTQDESRRTAIIIRETTRGFVFGEDVADHSACFIHLSSVENDHVPHDGDVISYVRLANPKNGRYQGIAVQYLAGQEVGQ